MDISHFAQTAGGLFASIFVVATYTMTTMIPLRVFGILTNIILIAFAIPMRHYPTLILHGVLLPLNIYRLHQMLQLVRNVKKSVTSDLSMDWLKPFMTERKYAAGDVLFYKNEKAEEMFYIVSGRFRLVSRRSNCRWGHWLANSVCCRRPMRAPRRWNALRLARFSA